MFYLIISFLVINNLIEGYNAISLLQGFKLTVAQSPMATRNAGWVPKNYILLAQFATMTSLKRSLFFLADF